MRFLGLGERIPSSKLNLIIAREGIHCDVKQPRALALSLSLSNDGDVNSHLKVCTKYSSLAATLPRNIATRRRCQSAQLPIDSSP